MFVELNFLVVCMFWNRPSFWNENEPISGMPEMNNRVGYGTTAASVKLICRGAFGTQPLLQRDL
jgi:hypothetical protein